jgi:hypothetical protein
MTKKSRYRFRNWAKYTKSLSQPGSLTRMALGRIRETVVYDPGQFVGRGRPKT